MSMLLCNCAHFTHQQGNVQNSSNQASTLGEPRTSRCTDWFRKGRGTRDQIANIHWIIEKRQAIDLNICTYIMVSGMRQWQGHVFWNLKLAKVEEHSFRKTYTIRLRQCIYIQNEKRNHRKIAGSLEIQVPFFLNQKCLYDLTQRNPRNSYKRGFSSNWP